MSVITTTSGRVFLICDVCKHWVKKLLTNDGCECICHIPTKDSEDKAV